MAKAIQELANSASPGIAIAAGPYRLRSLTADDASDRWAAWFSDPHVRHMLNSPGTAWTKETAAKYIRGFDQATNILLGIFAVEQNLLVGILTAKINPKTRQALITLLVGEPAYRDKRVWSTVRVPIMDYLFDTLRMKMILASALKRNNIIIDSMIKRGWKLDQTLKDHVKSNADGGTLDLCLFSLTRDAYRAWKKTQRRGSDPAPSLVESPE
jgi:RimJ/RimL family protein N-acetyltransferase